MSAVACVFLFLTFCRFFSTLASFWLTVGFVTTTIFRPYTKTAWDVLGACCFCCPLLYFACNVLLGIHPRRSLILATAALAGLGAFRYSLIPFMGFSLFLVVCFSSRQLNLKDVFLAGVAFVVLMLPTFCYNHLRTGSFLKPATTAPVFVRAGSADLSGNLLVGLYGLLISPNRGLLWFSPIFVLLLALPFVWSRLTRPARVMCIAFGTGAVLHLLMLAKLRSWFGPGGIAWGPRYLVSILPPLYFIVACVLFVAWKRFKVACIALVVLSAAVCAPPAFVNWGLATYQEPRVPNPYAHGPYEQLAVWRALIAGLKGQSLKALDNTDAVRAGAARFPDLWTVRLAERSKAGFLAGTSIAILLFAGMMSAGWYLARAERRQAFTPPSD